MAPALWTPAELGSYLRLSRASVYRMIQLRRVPFVKLAGGAVRFRPESIERWVQGQEITSTRAALIASRRKP